MARAVASAETTLRAGITTERDLGTEGAFDYDVQLKRAIDGGIVPATIGSVVFTMFERP